MVVDSDLLCILHSSAWISKRAPNDDLIAGSQLRDWIHLKLVSGSSLASADDILSAKLVVTQIILIREKIYRR